MGTDLIQLLVLNDLVITRCSDTKKPVGTFRCECGFVYSRRGPDRYEEDQFKIGRIKEFGQVWEEKLMSLINEGRRLRSIARELKCDPMTVKRQATLLGIPFSWEGESLEEASLKIDLQRSKSHDIENLNFGKYRFGMVRVINTFLSGEFPSNHPLSWRYNQIYRSGLIFLISVLESSGYWVMEHH